MDEYWTYRRVRFKSRAAGLTFNGITVAILLYILISIFRGAPYLVMEHIHQASFYSRLNAPRRPPCSAILKEYGAAALCQEWDWLDTVDKPGPELFVKTFVQETFEVRSAAATGRLWTRVNSTEFYIAPPEDFELILEHVTDYLESYSGEVSGQQMSGWLQQTVKAESVSSERQRITETDPEDPSHLARFPPNKRIILPLKQLLSAAEIDLEQECEACHHGAAKGRTVRRVGVNLGLTLTYSNMWNSTRSTGPLQYSIRVSHHEKNEGTREMEISRRGVGPDGVEWRVKRRSYGIQVTFSGEGMVGTFSWTALIAFVLTSLTQLALASTITEQVLTLMPPAELWKHSTEGGIRDKST